MTVDFVRLIQAVMYHVTSVVHVNAQSVVTTELTEVAGAQSEDRGLTPWLRRPDGSVGAVTPWLRRPDGSVGAVGSSPLDSSQGEEAKFGGSLLRHSQEKVSSVISDLPAQTRVVSHDDGAVESSPVHGVWGALKFYGVVLVYETLVISPLQLEMSLRVHIAIEAGFEVTSNI